MLILIFNSFVVPQQKANAIVWAGALPAGITIGGGAYALGALAVGSIAVGLGIEHGEEIKASAAKVWKSSTDLAKSSLQASMQLAVDTGDMFVKAGTDFASWISNKAGQLAGLALSASQGYEITKGITPTSKDVPTSEDANITTTISTSYPEVTRTFTYNPDAVTGKVKIQFPDTSTEFFAYMSAGSNSATNNGTMIALKSLELSLDSSGKIAVVGTMLTGSTVYPSREMNAILKGVAGYSADTWMDYTITNADGHTILGLILNTYTAEQMIDNLKRLGLDNVTIANQDLLDKWAAAKQKIVSQDIPNMKDAGLVLPVSDVVPTTTNGEALTYNPDTTTYVNTDGTVYTGDIAWTYPNVVIRDGVRVVPIEGNYVDITTGQVIGPVETPSPGNGSGTTRTFDMRPLIVAGERLKGKFPFSIPWDVYSLFNTLNVAPKTPVFKIDTGKGINLGGKNISVDYKFDIDFGVFDSIAKIFRWGMILVFDIAIVLALRRLTPD